ncbi:MAG TPA: acetyl-coenzyme A synthetase N-terminal domain-containing protein, partial [Phenylobacterium sp.]|nr:acetyl-coenzyme A synthetase N-terminal domain-containing protein [Phenylobacterium sp.]
MNADAYDAAVRRVDADADGYWRDLAHRLDWIQPFTEVKDVSFHKEDFHIRWFGDGVLNVSANCLDRHLATRGDQVALIWESDDGQTYDALTYRDLHTEVCRWANV